MSDDFTSGGSWTGIGVNALNTLTYPSGVMKFTRAQPSSLTPISIGASKTFTVNEAENEISFEIVSNSCGYPMTARIRDSLGVVVVSNTFTSTGTHTFTFSSLFSGTYKLEIYRTSTSSCNFSIDNVVIISNEISSDTICNETIADYRYAFNGKEKDDELKGEGNSYDYGFRMHDPRIGRFLSVDPLGHNFPWYSSYQFAGNKPIIAIDLEGAEEFIVIGDPSTAVSVNNTTTQNVVNALSGTPSSGPVNTASIALIPNGNLVTIQNAIIVWDPTARQRDQGGMIQYENVVGIGNQMRGMTPQELTNTFISTRLAIGTQSAKMAQILDGMETRQNSQGQQTNTNQPSNGHPSAQVSEGGVLTGENVVFLAITGPPSPVTLTSSFVPNTSNLQNGGFTPNDIQTMQSVANNLNNNSNLNFNLQGTLISGNANTWNGTAGMTGGQLATNRALAFANTLVNNFGVNPAQLSVSFGGTTGTASVNGVFRLNTTNPPNNGNKIDIVNPGP
jgi:RHS repeat-associated protein